MKIVLTQEQVEDIVLQHLKDVYDDDLRFIKTNTYSKDFVVASTEKIKED